MLEFRPSESLNQVDIPIEAAWEKARRRFSFAEYSRPENTNSRALRTVKDDTPSPHGMRSFQARRENRAVAYRARVRVPPRGHPARLGGSR